MIGGSIHDLEPLPVEEGEDRGQLVSTLDDLARRVGENIRALPAREVRPLLQRPGRRFGGALEHAEGGMVPEGADRVVAALARGDQLAVGPEDLIELAAVEPDALCAGS